MRWTAAPDEAFEDRALLFCSVAVSPYGGTFRRCGNPAAALEVTTNMASTLSLCAKHRETVRHWLGDGHRIALLESEISCLNYELGEAKCRIRGLEVELEDAIAAAFGDGDDEPILTGAT